jgi:hypothetical protein
MLLNYSRFCLFILAQPGEFLDKDRVQERFDHNGFLRHFFALTKPDAYPSAIWLPALNALFGELSQDELGLLELASGPPPTERAAFLRLDRKIRAHPRWSEINDALSRFEASFFCAFADGRCTRCGNAAGTGGPLCAARLGAFADPAADESGKMPEPEATDIPTDRSPASDPLLDFFKIPHEPGEINGFEYDALIDAAPVIVWRPACELETDFVEDVLAEAAAAGVTRVFLIARTGLGPEKLPKHPKVALILLPIPANSEMPAAAVIEADEVVYS